MVYFLIFILVFGLGFFISYMIDNVLCCLVFLIFSIVFTFSVAVLTNECTPKDVIIKHKQVYKVEKATLSGEGISVLYKTDYVECTKYCPVYVKSNRNEIEITNITQKGVWDWFVEDKTEVVYYGGIR